MAARLLQATFLWGACIAFSMGLLSSPALTAPHAHIIELHCTAAVTCDLVSVSLTRKASSVTSDLVHHRMHSHL